jgi:hypothetical protein
MIENELAFDSKWMKVRRTEKGFFYSERLGRDSIAVLCYRHTDNGTEALIRYQPLCINGSDTELMPCPITGSMDHDGEDPIDVAIREVHEEAGYVVDYPLVGTCGSYIVGTQTNERVFLFTVCLNDLEPVEIKGDGGFHESISHNKWEPLENIMEYEYAAFAQFLKVFFVLV